MTLSKYAKIWTISVTNNALGKSTCTATKHAEYSCMIKWSVDKKFVSSKWCKECKERYGKE